MGSRFTVWVQDYQVGPHASKALGCVAKPDWVGLFAPVPMPERLMVGNNGSRQMVLPHWTPGSCTGMGSLQGERQD